MTTQTRPRALVDPTPEPGPPGGVPTPHPTNELATPTVDSSGGDPTSRQARNGSTPVIGAPAGANSHPTVNFASPITVTSGGAQLAGRRERTDTHPCVAASDLPTDRHSRRDTQRGDAVGSEAGQDPAVRGATPPVGPSLLDPALALAADVLDDLERVRTANANRLRILTTTEADSDGEMRGFGLDESHPDVARLAAIVGMLGQIEKDAVKNLERHMRRHPLHPWAKSMRGVGDKQIARLLAAIGDPYIRPEIEREDGTIIPAGPRTVSALWAYCGLHVLPASSPTRADAHTSGAAGQDQLPADHHRADTPRRYVGGLGGDPGQEGRDTRTSTAGVAPKRARGQKANWSTRAKTKAYLIATSCLKQLVKPCADGAHVDDCSCSPYRLVYENRRRHTAGTRPDWTDGHSHNDALRVVSKAILRDLWREAKRLHEEGA